MVHFLYLLTILYKIDLKIICKPHFEANKPHEAIYIVKITNPHLHKNHIALKNIEYVVAIMRFIIILNIMYRKPPRWKPQFLPKMYREGVYAY